MARGSIPVAAALLWLPVCGCTLLGPTCVARRESGHVASIAGAVAAGSFASHRIAYGTEGSQNDVRVTWTGQSAAGGPHIQLYATRAGCTDFMPPPAPNSGDCSVLGAAGSIDGVVVNSLNVTHGRGNPQVLGSPPEFVVWVVGDHERTVDYAIDVTWLFGPDC